MSKARDYTQEVGADLHEQLGRHPIGQALTWDVPERSAELQLQVFPWGECVCLVAIESGEILMHMDVRR